MKVVNIHELEDVDATVLVSVYDPYLIDAKRVKVIGEKGFLFFEGENLQIDAKKCFTNTPSVLVAVKMKLSNIEESIGKIHSVFNADAENAIAMIESGNWGLVNGFDNHWNCSRAYICEDGRIIRIDEYNLSGEIKIEAVANPEEMKLIRHYIDDIYRTDEDTHRNGCDGNWYIFRLNLPNKEEILETKMGYIYGTEVLEPFAKLVGEITRRYEKTNDPLTDKNYKGADFISFEERVQKHIKKTENNKLNGVERIRKKKEGKSI